MPSKARHSQPLAPQWVPNLLIAVAIAAGLVGTTVYYEEIPHFAMKWVGRGERVLGLVSLDNFVRSLGTRFPFLNTAFAFYESQRSFLSQDFPLILPTPVLLLTALYVVGAQVLYLVFKHFKLKVSKPVLFLPRALYNFFLVALSTYIASEAFYSGVIISKNGVILNGRDPLPLDIRLARVGWVYYFSKLIEWVDTVLIIISGNFGQFSYLHWYHHATIFPFTSGLNLSHPHGNAWEVLFLNSLVHVVIYSYYLLSTFGYKPAWKVYLTYFQIFQFVLILCLSATDLYLLAGAGSYKTHLVLMVYMSSLILFFSNYLLQSTLKRGKKAPSRKAS